MDASALFREGRLNQAIEAATAAVKAKPSDVGCRGLLCDLLCCTADYDRADKQLDAISHLEPQLAVTIAFSRQLVRSARWRQQVFEEGRVPEVTNNPSPLMQAHLAALVDLRSGDRTAAATAPAAAELERPAVSGVCDGHTFDDLRDLDDLLAPVLEVFTATGKYYWIEWANIISLDIEPVRRIRDLLWRPARIQVRNGPDGPVHLPVLYPGSEKSSDDRIRLARLTEWEESPPIRGLGQRMLLVGDDAKPLLDIQQITVADASSKT